MNRPVEIDTSPLPPPAPATLPSTAPDKVVPIARRTRKVDASSPAPRPVQSNLSAVITQPMPMLTSSDLCKPPLMAARGEFEPGAHTPPHRRT